MQAILDGRIIDFNGEVWIDRKTGAYVFGLVVVIDSRLKELVICEKKLEAINQIIERSTCTTGDLDEVKMIVDTALDNKVTISKDEYESLKKAESDLVDRGAVW